MPTSRGRKGFAMNTTLTLTAHDPIVARDGRPFGIGQGNRMRGLGWPYPSVVAGSLRTALGKAADLQFTPADSKRLFDVEVAGVFPVVDGKTLYLPAPADCVAEEVIEQVDGKPEKRLVAHRAMPPATDAADEGCDWPEGAALRPVVIAKEDDFKPKDTPAWWPVERFAEWLTCVSVKFDESFLLAAKMETRDHVQLDADSGAAAESRLFATSGLSVTHLPRHQAKPETGHKPSFHDRMAEVTLAARVRADGWPAMEKFDTWHPLGGERRLIHWANCADAELWKCPGAVATSLAKANRVRMVLATPAIFEHGWRPGWLNDQLEGTPPGCELKLRLVGVCIPRWKAVSGWSLAEPRGPKPVRRLVPAGGAYFFEMVGSDTALSLEKRWLEPVSDNEQARRDGFGLAVWGTW
ncbi:MAG: hypothetical protein C0467_30545 [Planctomycetaceae bacterium]|nr:hypothetical protein [Planctomycetaceae bacterium]